VNKVNISTIKLPSFWGTEVKQKHYKIQQRSTKLAVLFPGKHYSCERPALYYAGTSAVQCGFDLLVLEYGYQAARADLDIDDLPKIIDECMECIQPIVNQYEQTVFISKSLGTVIAGEVHERLGTSNIHHIFVTPIENTRPYMNRTTGIVIYGTRDSLFSKELVDQITSGNMRVIEVPDADHSLETMDVRESIIIQKTLAEIYLDYLSSI
jgi:surfactin synthase thioesterase subunit